MAAFAMTSGSALAGRHRRARLLGLLAACHPPARYSGRKGKKSAKRPMVTTIT
jgi:hypothetical protein